VSPAAWSALVAIALAAAAPDGRPGEKPVVAVFDVELGAGAAGADQAALTEVLAKALTDREAWQVTTVRDLASLLGAERRRQLLGCSTDSCLAELASSFGSEGAVISSVGQVGGQLVASGRITSPRGGTALARASVQVVGDDLPGALQALGAALRNGYRKARGLAVAGVEGGGAAAGGECLAAADCEAECRGGVAAACARLGKLLGADEARPLRAAAIQGRACDLGDLASCLVAARALQAHAFHREALPLLQKGCGAEGPWRTEACLRTGRLLLAARQVERDLDQGLTLLGFACDRSDGTACQELGVALDDGEAKGRDEPLANRALEQACTLGRAEGCLLLASRAEAGRGLARDLPRASALRQSACRLGSAAACSAAARTALLAGQPRRALELWLDTCHGKSAEAPAACAAAAEVLIEGPTEVRELAQGRAAAQLACTRGEGRGCMLAAQALAGGERPDWGEVRRLLERGCAPAGTACGKFLAGQVLRLPESFAAFALAPLESACQAGDAGACHAAAVLFEKGRGVVKSESRARGYQERGCRAGGAADCLAWGEYLEGRFGGEEAAFEAYRLGCKARSGPCCGRLADLTSRQPEFSRRSERVLSLRREACQLGEKSYCD
jgi:TPR repeat protein